MVDLLPLPAKQPLRHPPPPPHVLMGDRPQPAAPRQVGAMLGISTEVVRRLARANKLPHIKVGGSLRFKRSVIENLDQVDTDT